MKVERLLAIGIVAAVMALGWMQFARAQAPGQGGTGTANDITPTEETAASPWGWLKMPTVTMPKITMPKMPADPLAPLKTSARKVSDGTKKAWEGTKELFTGGSTKDEPAARVAANGESPSLMQRMFGGGEEPKNDGPATVKEWMSQERPQ